MLSVFADDVFVVLAVAVLALIIADSACNQLRSITTRPSAE